MIVDQEKPKERYQHQDYPRVVYRGNVEHKKVQNQVEEDAAIEAGFTRTPPAPYWPGGNFSDDAEDVKPEKKTKTK